MEKIIFAVESYPPAHSGAGLRAARLANRLSKKGLANIQLICRGKDKKRAIKNLSITCLDLPEEDGIRFPYFFFKTFFAAKHYLANNGDEFQVIHAFSPSWYNRIILLCNHFFFKKKTIIDITLDGSDDPVSLKKIGLRNRLLWPLTKFILNKTDLFIVSSNSARDSCINVGINPNKIILRQITVDENIFGNIPLKDKHKLRKKLNLPEGITLLNVGALSNRKNQLSIIKALSICDRKDLNLVLIGPNEPEEPEYSRKVVELIKELELEKRVFLTGKKENVNEYMAACDIFIFPSRMEGFPNVIPEALESGLPVIVTDLPRIRSIVNSKNGVILPNAKDDKKMVVEIKRKIDRMTSSLSKYNRENIRKDAMEKFSTFKSDNNQISTYRSLKP